MPVVVDRQSKGAAAVDADAAPTRRKRELRPWLSEIRRQLTNAALHYRAGYLYRIDLNSAKLSDCDRRADWRIRRLTDEETAQMITWNVSEEAMQRRRVAGDVCYGVVLGGEVVYSHWLTHNTCYIRGADLLIRLGLGDCYYYNAITKPGFRGKGIGRIAQQQFLSVAANEGVGRLIAYVESDNKIARHITEQLATERPIKARSFRALGLRIGNYYDAAKSTHSRKLMNRLEQQVYWI